jgi:hypothetical protein
MESFLLPILNSNSTDSMGSCSHTPTRQSGVRRSPTHLFRQQLERDYNFRPSSPTDEIFESPCSLLKKAHGRNDLKQ